jgi:putative nucleotidyltransferase with HDIG domain
MVTYTALLAAANVLLAYALVRYGQEFPAPWALLLLAPLAIVAERTGIRISGNLTISVALLPTLFAGVALGPLAGMSVGALSMLGGLRPSVARWAVYTCTSSLVGGLSGMAAAVAESVPDSELGKIAFATTVAAISAQVLDASFCVLTLTLRRTVRPTESVRAALPVLPSSLVLYVAVVGLLTLAYREISPWSVGFFLVPAIAAQRLFAMYQSQRELAKSLAVANAELEAANLSFAGALVAALDARDRYTAGHSAAVAVYAHDIAANLGLSSDDQKIAHLAGLLHDIGKIGVSPTVLEKPGPLTVIERREMEQHPVIGEGIISNVKAYAEIARIVRHHHERMDGMGYPDGIRGNQIPLISRIICVADAYNAMTSDRPYRDAMSVQVARQRLREAAGTHFDPNVVIAFDRLLETASPWYLAGTGLDFSMESRSHPELLEAA